MMLDTICVVCDNREAQHNLFYDLTTRGSGAPQHLAKLLRHRLEGILAVTLKQQDGCPDCLCQGCEKGLCDIESRVRSFRAIYNTTASKYRKRRHAARIPYDLTKDDAWSCERGSETAPDRTLCESETCQPQTSQVSVGPPKPTGTHYAVTTTHVTQLEGPVESQGVGNSVQAPRNTTTSSIARSEPTPPYMQVNTTGIQQTEQNRDSTDCVNQSVSVHRQLSQTPINQIVHRLPSDYTCDSARLVQNSISSGPSPMRATECSQPDTAVTAPYFNTTSTETTFNHNYTQPQDKQRRPVMAAEHDKQKTADDHDTQIGNDQVCNAAANSSMESAQNNSEEGLDLTSPYKNLQNDRAQSVTSEQSIDSGNFSHTTPPLQYRSPNLHPSSARCRNQCAEIDESALSPTVTGTEALDLSQTPKSSEASSPEVTNSLALDLTVRKETQCQTKVTSPAQSQESCQQNDKAMQNNPPTNDTVDFSNRAVSSGGRSVGNNVINLQQNNGQNTSGLTENGSSAAETLTPKEGNIEPIIIPHTSLSELLSPVKGKMRAPPPLIHISAIKQEPVDDCQYSQNRKCISGFDDTLKKLPIMIAPVGDYDQPGQYIGHDHTMYGNGLMYEPVSKRAKFQQQYDNSKHNASARFPVLNTHVSATVNVANPPRDATLRGQTAPMRKAANQNENINEAEGTIQTTTIQGTMRIPLNQLRNLHKAPANISLVTEATVHSSPIQSQLNPSQSTQQCTTMIPMNININAGRLAQSMPVSSKHAPFATSQPHMSKQYSNNPQNGFPRQTFSPKQAGVVTEQNKAAGLYNFIQMAPPVPRHLQSQEVYISSQPMPPQIKEKNGDKDQNQGQDERRRSLEHAENNVQNRWHQAQMQPAFNTQNPTDTQQMVPGNNSSQVSSQQVGASLNQTHQAQLQCQAQPSQGQNPEGQTKTPRTHEGLFQAAESQQMEPSPNTDRSTPKDIHHDKENEMESDDEHDDDDEMNREGEGNTETFKRHESSRRRQLLRPWLEERLDRGNIPGFQWVSKEQNFFRIPWKHRSKNDWSPENCTIFREWAIHTGKYRPGMDKPDYCRWKTRLRCAFNQAADIVECKDLRKLKCSEPYKVYAFLPKSEVKLKPRTKVQVSPVSSMPSYGGMMPPVMGSQSMAALKPPGTMPHGLIPNGTAQSQPSQAPVVLPSSLTRVAETIAASVMQNPTSQLQSPPTPQNTPDTLRLPTLPVVVTDHDQNDPVSIPVETNNNKFSWDADYEEEEEERPLVIDLDRGEHTENGQVNAKSNSSQQNRRDVSSEQMKVNGATCLQRMQILQSRPTSRDLLYKCDLCQHGFFSSTALANHHAEKHKIANRESKGTESVTRTDSVAEKIAVPTANIYRFPILPERPQI